MDIINFHRAEEHPELYRFLVNLLGDKREHDIRDSHSVLLRLLFEKDFYWFDSNQMDEKQFERFKSIRMMYNESTDGPKYNYIGRFDNLPGVTIFEAILGLAIDGWGMVYDANNPTTVYDIFVEFLDNLGILVGMDDKYINSNKIMEVSHKITNWLDRKYFPTGIGSPFGAVSDGDDARLTDIWLLLCRWAEKKVKI